MIHREYHRQIDAFNAFIWSRICVVGVNVNCDSSVAICAFVCKYCCWRASSAAVSFGASYGFFFLIASITITTTAITTAAIAIVG